MSLKKRLCEYAADAANFGRDEDETHAATLVTLTQDALSDKLQLLDPTGAPSLHHVFHILANLRGDNGEYLAELCLFPPRAPDPQGGLRYPLTATVTRVVLRDARAFLCMLCALSLFDELGRTERVGGESMQFARAWHYCVYCGEDFADEKGSYTKELSHTKKLRCDTHDHAFLFGGGTVVLERRLIVCDDAKYNRLCDRIPNGMMMAQGAYQWLHTAPDHPYIEALQRQPLLDERDVFKAYEYLFYVCLENCSVNLPEVGSVAHRDFVSGRPLCFRIRDKTRFFTEVMAGFKPPQLPEGAPVLHDMIDTTCVGPLVLTEDTESVMRVVKKDQAWKTRLATLHKKCPGAGGGAFLAAMLYVFYANNPREYPFPLLHMKTRKESCLLHMSLYSPNYV